MAEIDFKVDDSGGCDVNNNMTKNKASLRTLQVEQASFTIMKVSQVSAKPQILAHLEKIIAATQISRRVPCTTRGVNGTKCIWEMTYMTSKVEQNTRGAW